MYATCWTRVMGTLRTFAPKIIYQFNRLFYTGALVMLALLCSNCFEVPSLIDLFNVNLSGSYLALCVSFFSLRNSVIFPLLLIFCFCFHLMTVISSCAITCVTLYVSQLNEVTFHLIKLTDNHRIKLCVNKNRIP
jgi:hypothetical protein